MRNEETALMVRIQDALSKTGRCLLWRNSTGGAKTEGGGWMSFGLGKGSADLIGVHIPSGRFIGVEVKVEGGRLRPEQLAWQRAVLAAGGSAVVVRSVEEALTWLKGL